MRTTAEQRAVWRAGFQAAGPVIDQRLPVLLDDLDEALAEVAALRARLQAAEATIRVADATAALALDRLKVQQAALDDMRALTLTSQREVALLAEVAALRAVAEAARARCRDAVPEWAPELRAALRAWEERER